MRSGSNELWWFYWSFADFVDRHERERKAGEMIEGSRAADEARDHSLDRWCVGDC